MSYTLKTSFAGFTDIDPGQINRFILSRHPEVDPPGTMYVTFAKKYDIKPELAVAMAVKETGWFRSTNWRVRRNPAGIKGGDGWRTFGTAREGIWEHCRLIRERYLTPGTFQWDRQKRWGTPGTLFPVLMVWVAESEASVRSYANQVCSWAEEIASTPMPAEETRGIRMSDAVKFTIEEGIMVGHPTPRGLTLFHPYWPLTRAEFATVLSRTPPLREALDRVKPAPAPPDARGHWAEENIRKVVGAGWMTGDPDGRFRPNDTITRAETLSVLARASAPGIKAVEGRPPRRFADVSPSAWYAEVVEWGYRKGWLEEFTEGNRFVPNAPITRVETAFLIENMLKQPEALAPAAWYDSWTEYRRIMGLVATGAAPGDQAWVPRWAVPAFYTSEETWDLPYTLVEPRYVSGATTIVSRKPYLIVGIGLVGAAALGLALARR